MPLRLQLHASCNTTNAQYYNFIPSTAGVRKYIQGSNKWRPIFSMQRHYVSGFAITFTNIPEFLFHLDLVSYLQKLVVVLREGLVEEAAAALLVTLSGLVRKLGDEANEGVPRARVRTRDRASDGLAFCVQRLEKIGQLVSMRWTLHFNAIRHTIGLICQEENGLLTF